MQDIDLNVKFLIDNDSHDIENAQADEVKHETFQKCRSPCSAACMAECKAISKKVTNTISIFLHFYQIH
mgnify:CR=1 FL=1